MWGFTSLCFFPTLVALAIFKDAWVKDVWCSIEGGGGVGVRTSLDRLMIGRWMRCTSFFQALMGREFSRKWKIGCFGERLNVESFLLSLSTKH